MSGNGFLDIPDSLPAKVEPIPQPEDVLGEARAFLSTLPGSIAGEGGNAEGGTKTFKDVMAALSRFDLTDDEAFTLIRDAYNPRCQPPWSEPELRHKIADVRKVLLEQAGIEDRPTVAGFQWSKRGLSYVKDEGKDGDGVPKPSTTTWIAPPFTLPGLVRDANSHGWRLLMAWQDLDGVQHEEALPFDLLNGEGMELARILGQGGMMLPPDPGLRKALLRYLCAASGKVKNRVRLVDSLGWQDGGAFVHPDGQTIGQTLEPVRFSGEGHLIRRAHSLGGTLEGWQEEVAAYAIGEPRLAFGIAVAFAGPVLRLVRPDGGGGFNLQGQSSKGKSTILEASASVWHNPEQIPTWRATSNGLEGIAASRNDGFLPLDEMGQARADELGPIAYMLANGSAKVRQTRDGGLRSLKQWRLIFLASGEQGIEDKLSEDGKRSKAGQEVRVPDIPCSSSGMLEDPHGFPSLGAFAEHLKASSRTHYGHASRAFIEKLCEGWGDRDALRTRLKEMEANWMDSTIPAGVDAQVRRVGGRFALVAVAGELAQEMGILPWPKGEASKAAAVCFKAWLERRGFSGASEAHKGIASVLDFLDRHGNSRFDRWEDLRGSASMPNTLVMNRAGTKRWDESAKGWDYYLTSEGWKEACRGFSAPDVSRACVEAGLLKPDGQGKSATPTLIPGYTRNRYYIIRASARAAFQEDKGEILP
jgi:uncharacterized protein (DUF927 family)